MTAALILEKKRFNNVYFSIGHEKNRSKQIIDVTTDNHLSSNNLVQFNQLTNTHSSSHYPSSDLLQRDLYPQKVQRIRLNQLVIKRGE